MHDINIAITIVLCILVKNQTMGHTWKIAFEAGSSAAGTSDLVTGREPYHFFRLEFRMQLSQ